MAGTPFSPSISFALSPEAPLAALTLRVEYVTGTNQPLYVGQAPMGSSDSNVLSTQWTVVKYAYDVSLNVISQKVAINGAWANRTTLTYA